MNIRDLPARLPNDQIARGVIPDLLLVVLPHGQAEVEIARPARHRPVFRLAVHLHRLARDAEDLRDVRVVAFGGVAGLDGFTHHSLADVRDLGDVDRAAGA